MLASACSNVTYPNATGTWQFALVSHITPSEPPSYISGPVTTSGSNATASLTPAGPCFSGMQVSFSGTIDDTGVLKMTSEAYNNQTIYFTGTLSPDGSFFTSGTYTVSPQDNRDPSCAGSDSGTVTGKRISTSTTGS